MKRQLSVTEPDCKQPFPTLDWILRPRSFSAKVLNDLLLQVGVQQMPADLRLCCQRMDSLCLERVRRKSDVNFLPSNQIKLMCQDNFHTICLVSISKLHLSFSSDSKTASMVRVYQPDSQMCSGPRSSCVWCANDKFESA